MNPCTRRNAILPEDMEEPTLDSMLPGEGAYTVSWAMWVDRDRGCWLNPSYRVTPRVLGTSRMRVERHEDGYHVWVVPGEKYRPEDGPQYAGQELDTEWLPVVAIHR